MTTEGQLILWALGALVCWAAWFWVKDKYYRFRGVRVERKAVKALRLPRSWQLQPDVPVPGLGNCDALIVSAKGNRFAVEIKSAESAKKVWFSFFTNDEIRKGNGDRFARDHINQTLKVATRLDATPVLWFPRAQKNKRFKTRSGVIVVLGGRRMLERAVGARWGFFWL